MEKIKIDEQGNPYIDIGQIRVSLVKREGGKRVLTISDQKGAGAEFDVTNHAEETITALHSACVLLIRYKG